MTAVRPDEGSIQLSETHQAPRRQFVFFANPGSGERSAFDSLHDELTQRYPGCIVNLAPRKGYENDPHGPEVAGRLVIEKGLTGEDVVVVAGGDGTVSWGMNIVEQCVQKTGNSSFNARPYIAVIPLGTGNDLSRDWGCGPGFSVPACGDPNASVKKALRLIEEGRPSVHDRWQVQLWGKKEMREEEAVVQRREEGGIGATVEIGPLGTLMVSDVDDGGPAHQAGLAKHCELLSVGDEQPRSPREFDQIVSSGPANVRLKFSRYEEKSVGHASTSNNYISIGFDAQIAVLFDRFRKRYPKWCRKRILNKVWYGIFGASALIGSPVVSKAIRLRYRKTEHSDIQEVDISTLSLKTLVFTNVNSYAAGMVPWSLKSGRMLNGEQASAPQTFDRRLEVCGFDSTVHMGLATIGVRTSHRICQAHEIFVEFPAYNDAASGISGLRMQIDGEPLTLPRFGGCVRISFQKAARCLVAPDRAVAPQELIVGRREGSAVPAAPLTSESRTPPLSSLLLPAGGEKDGSAAAPARVEDEEFHTPLAPSGY